MANTLRHFTPEEIIITEEEARTIYRFFFGDNKQIMKVVDSDKPFQHLHLEFAQALLVEGIDRSYDMGYVESLFKSFFSKNGTVNSAKKVVKKFGKKAFKHWFKHATEDDLWNDAEVYDSVRAVIAEVWSREAIFMLTQDQSMGGY